MREKRDTHLVEHRIAALAARQHGVVSRRQLLRLGLTSAAIGRRVGSGRLHPLHRGVYAVGHTALSREGRWLAAVLACPPGAALSHGAAAALWGLRPPVDALPVDVTVATTGGCRHHDGVVVHRSGTLDEQDVTHHRGVPVTTPARTLIDLAEIVPRRVLERAMDEAEAELRLDWRTVRDVIDRHPGRVGAARVRTVLARHDVGSTLTRSALEEMVLDLCDRHGLSRPLVNASVSGLEADFWWPAQRLVLEADSRRYHDTRAAFERDRIRDATLLLDGVRVVRVTFRRVTEAPDEVAALLTALLAG